MAYRPEIVSLFLFDEGTGFPADKVQAGAPALTRGQDATESWLTGPTRWQMPNGAYDNVPNWHTLIGTSLEWTVLVKLDYYNIGSDNWFSSIGTILAMRPFDANQNVVINMNDWNTGSPGAGGGRFSFGTAAVQWGDTSGASGVMAFSHGATGGIRAYLNSSTPLATGSAGTRSAATQGAVLNSHLSFYQDGHSIQLGQLALINRQLTDTEVGDWMADPIGWLQQPGGAPTRRSLVLLGVS